MVQSYCVKCKARQEMNNPREITMKNGKPAVQGLCPVCGTKMFKIGEAGTFSPGILLYSVAIPNERITAVRYCLKEINDDLLSYLSAHPEQLYNLEARRFEEMVATLLERDGYEVMLTPKTRDGGKDIYAISRSDIGEVLTVIECKKYAPCHPVGVEIVRALYGVKMAERANMGVVVTTSGFTKPAWDFKRNVGFEINLRDYNDLVKWLRRVQVSYS
jgi:restriction endonuclease Mrr